MIKDLVILNLNLPAIDALFRRKGVVAFTDNYQLVAMDKSVLKQINPNYQRTSSWINDLLSQFWTEEEINTKLSGDDCDYPVEWYPDIPFQVAFYCKDHAVKAEAKAATEKAIALLKDLKSQGVEIPECYEHLV